MELYKNKQWLEEQYTKEKLTAKQIATKVSRSKTTIFRWLHRLGIETWDVADYERRVRHIDLSERLRELLEGELLGDGYIGINNKSGYYMHSSKYPEYLQWLFGLLEQEGLLWNGKIRYKRSKNGNSYSASTYSYRELMDMREKWYVGSKKIIPRDLEFTPTIIRHWYIGDGNLRKVTTCRMGQIQIATNGFLREDVKFLRSKLSMLGIPVNISKQNAINFGRVWAVKKFFNYIGDCPEGIRNIYGYKWLNNGNEKANRTLKGVI